MMTKTTLAILSSLLLLSGLAQANSGPTDSLFDATSVYVRGDGAIAGTLAALQLADRGPNDGTLDASGAPILVEADYVRGYGAVAVAVQASNGTLIQSENATSLDSAAFRDGYLLFVSAIPGRPVPGVILNAQNAAINPSTATTVYAPNIAAVRPDPDVDVRDTLEIKDLSGRVSITIVGESRMILWRVSAQLHAPGHEQIIWSGDEFQPVAVPKTEVLLRTYEDRSLFINVFGEIKLEIPGESLQGLYLHKAAAESSEGLHAVGVDGTDYDLEPGVRCEITDGEKGLRVRVLAAEESARALAAPTIQPAPPGGDTIARSTITGANQFSHLPETWMLLAGFAAITPFAGWATRRQVHARRFTRLEHDFDEGEYESVLKLANRLRGSKRYRWDAGSMAVVALVRLERDEEALAALGTLEDLPEANEQGLDYLAACIAIARGAPADAAALLGPLLQGDEDDAPQTRTAWQQPTTHTVRPEASGEGYA